jgi:hypothetical protein
MNEVKTVFKATFALLGIMVVATVIVDRFMDNPAQGPGDSKT